MNLRCFSVLLLGLVATPTMAQRLAMNPATEQWFHQLDPFTVSWSVLQREQLHQLEVAANRYFAYSQGFEAKKVGDAVNEGWRQEFIGELKSMDAGQWPAWPAPGEASESRLNMLYSKICDQLRAPSKENTDFIITTEYEKNLELGWIAFRDAWTALITARYGEQKAMLWRAHLTAERIALLQTLSGRLAPVDPEAKNWLATCTRYRGTPLPQEMRAPRALLNGQTCQSVSSYYGLGTPVDYAGARRCAVLERAGISTYDEPSNVPLDEPARLGISGSGTLAMIYVNGNGVPSNTALALRFACEAIDAGMIGPPDVSSPDNPEEDKAVFPALIAAAGGSQTDFDLCNYALEQGRMLSTCEFIPRLREDLQRKADIESFAAKFTAGQKAAYLKMVSAFESYLEAHDEQETAVMGHYPFSASWQLQPQQELDFIATMQRFESGDLPAHTDAEFAVADRDLNVRYKDTMQAASHPKEEDVAPPTPENLRNTERIWLTYRDAWVEFGRLRYPQVSKESWLTWMTLQREEDLKNFGQNIP